MTANIVELETQSTPPFRRTLGEHLPMTYEALGGDVCGRQSARRLIRVDDHP